MRRRILEAEFRPSGRDAVIDALAQQRRSREALDMAVRLAGLDEDL
jgi:hypothetical protein